MDKNNEGPKVICKYCGYKIDKDKIKEHEEKYCDQNTKATNPVKGDKIKEMKGKNKSFYLWRNMFVFMVFIFLIGWWLITPTEDDNIYPGDVTEVKEYIKNTKIDQFSNIKEMHWDHTPLTYHYDPSCYGPIIPRIELAFEIITNETDSFVRFAKVEENADINFLCYPSQNIGVLIYQDATEYTYGLASPVIYGNQIINSTIEFWSIRNNSMPPDCYTFPRLTIHEILHILGFGHDEANYYSVMYPYGGSECIKEDNRTTTIIATGETFIPKNEIDKKIVSCLKYIYSNGEVGFCGSDVNFMNFISECSEDWYPVSNSDYCCPEPNMIIDEEGYCAVGQEIV